MDCRIARGGRIVVNADWTFAHATTPDLVRNTIEDYRIWFFCISCIYVQERIDVRAYNSTAIMEMHTDVMGVGEFR